MKTEILVHPGFHRAKSGEATLALEAFEGELIARIGDQALNLVLFCEPRNIDDTFYRATDPERIFVSDLGEVKIWDECDIERLSRVLKGTTSFLVHGCYMEQCVYDIATRLHDALMRGRYDELAMPRDIDEVWTPLGRMEDAKVEFGHVLRQGQETIPIDPRVFPFIGDSTFIHLTS